jgi:hypothetical protein
LTNKTKHQEEKMKPTYHIYACCSGKEKKEEKRDSVNPQPNKTPQMTPLEKNFGRNKTKEYNR